ncbi:hypothetical protein PS2_006778 [Malus domestica]
MSCCLCYCWSRGSSSCTWWSGRVPQSAEVTETNKKWPSFFFKTSSVFPPLSPRSLPPTLHPPPLCRRPQARLLQGRDFLQELIARSEQEGNGEVQLQRQLQLQDLFLQYAFKGLSCYTSAVINNLHHP